jgi:malonyl-CoA O-methyltransferase
MTQSPFSARVRQAFARRVASYEPMAPLQRGMAWRLAGVAARHLGSGGLPAGLCADLGAGTGLAGRALAARGVALPAPLEQLDLCPEALARNRSGPPLPWDLNQGLPAHLNGAALLTSSFALQWLADPAATLALWAAHLAPGGALLLSVPTAGSFPEWRQAAHQAQVPCSALPLPAAEGLLAAVAAAGLETIEARVLTFSRPARGGGVRSAPAPEAGAGPSGQGDPAAERSAVALSATPAQQGATRAFGAASTTSISPTSPTSATTPTTPIFSTSPISPISPTSPASSAAPAAAATAAAAATLAVPAASTTPPSRSSSSVPAVPTSSTAPGRHPALEALRAIRAIGADATPGSASLSPGDWRRLLAAWPPGEGLSWEVLVLLARRPSASASKGAPPCAW